MSMDMARMNIDVSSWGPAVWQWELYVVNFSYTKPLCPFISLDIQLLKVIKFSCFW